MYLSLFEFAVLALLCALALVTLLVVPFFYHSCETLHPWRDTWTLDELAQLRNNNSFATSFHPAPCLLKCRLCHAPFLIFHNLGAFLVACEPELTLAVWL